MGNCCNIDGGASVDLVVPDSTLSVESNALPMLLNAHASKDAAVDETSKNDPSAMKQLVQEGKKSELESVHERSGTKSWRPENVVNAVFDVDGTEQAIMLKFSPLGLKFYPRMPIVVKGFEDHAYGETLGIQTGWILKSLDSDDILGKPDFKTALEAMRDHLQCLPAYDHKS
eukprot:CAMPEP_0169108564 /NCGR_PEP_ID=MMETSP1015-20121227/25495_1 /TAXON_ID=342587 /ORGANISM="Karlodinium micrum, Strain CCMP2283" /LENGTH=171 /DNA_ID=CAMNT_0009170195 /DNA_START=42 /DNA_END=557 /DNA_ORIENTATION=+